MFNTGNTYTDEYRQDAVDLLLSSQKPLKQVARELGVSANALRSWRNKLTGRSPVKVTGAEGDADRNGASPSELATKIRDLEKEVAYLRRQREILKKAASILAEDPQLGMR